MTRTLHVRFVGEASLAVSRDQSQAAGSCGAEARNGLRILNPSPLFIPTPPAQSLHPGQAESS